VTLCSCCQPECEVDGDCYYFLASVSAWNDPDCPAEYFLAYFDNFDDAAAWGLPYAEDGDCGTVVIDSGYGKCCDGECFPFFDSLPYFTNDEVSTCP